LIVPGLDFATAISSFSVFAGKDGKTLNASGTFPVSTTCVKSFSG
jgi:hypothetical protein